MDLSLKSGKIVLCKYYGNVANGLVIGLACGGVFKCSD